MIDEIRKSINSILYERVSSPLYGTFLVSWFIINWRILYLTLFVDQDKIVTNKIDFIIQNYFSFKNLVIFPAISTLLLLTVIPYLTNGAYWLDLKFKTWRVTQKNQIEGKQLLTLEQSIRLRTEMREMEDSFDKLLERKNEEIKTLKTEIENQHVTNLDKSDTKTSKEAPESRKGLRFTLRDYNEFAKNQKLYEVFEKIATSLRETKQFPQDIDVKIKEYYLVNEIVYEDEDVLGNKIYFLTNKGEGIYREHFNKSFRDEN